MDLIVDEHFLQRLTRYNIFQCRTGMRRNHPEPPKQRFKISDVLRFDKDTCIEEFSTIGSGNILYSCGSFSGIVSPLPLGSKVGRFTEVAVGGSLFGFRHPMEAVSMNSAVFNFSRENIYPYFQHYEKKYGKLNKQSVPTPQPQTAPVRIGHDVWIGSNVALRGGITIHNGAVIAANSIVTRDVPPYAIVAGSPAHVKKMRFPDKIIETFQEIKYWDYELGDMFAQNMNFSSPEKFISQFSANVHKLRKYTPRKFYPAEYAVSFDSGKPVPKGALITEHNTILCFDTASKKIIHTRIKNTDNSSKIPLILARDSRNCYLTDKKMIRIQFNGGGKKIKTIP